MPLLARVALTVYAITPSEACCERSFSHQGLLHSSLRGNLDDESIHALLSVRMNILRLFNIHCMPRQKWQKTG